MSLKIKDIQVGDELECIDEDYYFKHLRFRLSKELKVSFVYDHSFKINDCMFPSCDLKYFKKKEQSQYTLDDLISISNKAIDDGLSLGLTLIYSDENGDRYTSFDATQNKIKQEIDYIKSLYKETFVIECEEDIKRIKKGAEITLQNGNKSKVLLIFSEINAIKVDGWDFVLQFFSLKGATVEQERGCNE